MSPDSVFATLVEAARDAPDREFLCVPPLATRAYHPGGLALSYRQVLDAVDGLRQDLDAAGYGEGHRVALFLGNRPEYFLCWFALNGLGASVVPIHPDAARGEIAYLVEHSQAELVLTTADARAAIAAAVQPLARPPAVGIAAARGGEVPRARTGGGGRRPGLASECALLYTSGTTGRPKGCLLANEYFLTTGRWYVERGGRMALRPGEERLLNPLPFSHMNAMAASTLAMMLTRGCLVVPDRFHPRSWWRDVAGSRATIVHYLGVMPPLLLGQPPTPDERDLAVRFGFGAGLDPRQHRAFEARFGFPMLEGWGMTETGRFLIDNHEPRQIDTRAIGRPGPGLEGRVVDAEDRPVPPDTDGELVVRAGAARPRQGFFAGYLKDPAATAAAWRGEWFHTGDVVRQDASGMLYFVDRIKNIIRRSGENISAAEVESALRGHPDVAQVAVLAQADALREEEVRACVVLRSGVPATAATADALFAWCRERLAYHKLPGWVSFVAVLPITGTQKVQKSLIFPTGEDPRRTPGTFDLRARKRREAS